MTTEERRALRQALIEQGFTPGFSTQDFGDGIYSQTFNRKGASVVVQWGPKTPDAVLDSDDENLAEHTARTLTKWAC